MQKIEQEENSLSEEEECCDECGGQRRWCESCEMWSRTCCEHYGTCMCS
jgi:hypothetical protein